MEAIKPSRIRIILAFLTIYLIWGSTYIAIKFALESFPPFLMGATRFFTAGLIMCGWMLLRGAPRPNRSHMLPTLALGILLLVIGNTGVVLAEKTVPSGMVSLLAATVPIFIVTLQWLKPKGIKPTKRVILGLITGLSGLVFLIEPQKFAGADSIDLLGVSFVLTGCLSSAVGAIYSRSAHLPSSQQLTAGLQMLFASLILFVCSACAGEFSQIEQLRISFLSGISWLYLVVFGSMIAFSVYIWLLKQVNPAHVSTYAYVNPIVAIFLGWWLAGETISIQTFFGAGVILAAVWLITQNGPKPEPALALAGDATALEACALE
ncbi:MAG: EamA family transporter [Candidatus Melainabacteria bacterium]|nr:EamA family transporter [Candidatus Melainabacteria bacterium]